MPAPAGAHVLLDLGAEEYTVGRPHPMIDPTSRIDLMREQGATPRSRSSCSTSCSATAPTRIRPESCCPSLPELMADGGPQVVAYVLGSDSDPQDYGRQRAALEGIGCIVTETAARAAYAAAAIALRRPEFAEEILTPNRFATPRRAGHLQHPPAWRRRAHAGTRRGHARPRPGRPDRRPRRSRPPASSARCRRRRISCPPPQSPGISRRRSPPTSTRSRSGSARSCPATPILHTQDCISARAAARVRDAGAAGAGDPHRPPRR